MSRIMIICALAAIFTMPAQADETLRLRYAAHLTVPYQGQEVGDVDGHIMGLFSFHGITLLPDGSTGTIRWTGTQEIIKGVGSYLAYANLTFSDGSVLWYKTAGSQLLDGTKPAYKGPLSVIGGKGRFEGAKGDGTVSGARIGSTETGADQYGELVINVVK